MKAKIPKMQNEDGTLAGRYGITGRVAVTSAAILMPQHAVLNLLQHSGVRQLGTTNLNGSKTPITAELGRRGPQYRENLM